MSPVHIANPRSQAFEDFRSKANGNFVCKRPRSSAPDLNNGAFLLTQSGNVIAAKHVSLQLGKPAPELRAALHRPQSSCADRRSLAPFAESMEHFPPLLRF